ncbi:MAG: hypothetical protein R2684_05585 [Pyrinomonadaceae bacterium]
MFESLVYPKCPHVALGFGNKTVTAVSLQKIGSGRFTIRRAATSDFDETILIPSFDDLNIMDFSALMRILGVLVTDAGLGSQKRWSVALPASSARTSIITLDDTPTSRTELEEMLDWKSEIAFGAPINQLRVSRDKIADSIEGRARYFATAVRLSVLEQYEDLFSELGWHVGMILPRAVSESRWFSRAHGDSLLISTQDDGFTALLMRDNEPVVVRSVTCRESEIDDEVYRLLVYYQDRVAASATGQGLTRLLVLGDNISSERIGSITDEAMGRSLPVARPEELGFEIPAGGLRFGDLAAPAGLAALAWL